MDEVLNAQGIFNGMTVVVDGIASVGQTVSKFSKALETPGLLEAAYGNFKVRIIHNQTV